MAADTGLKALLQQNPFPHDHPHHAIYVRWARHAAEGQARIAAEYGERALKASAEEMPELQADAIGALLDHWISCYFPLARALPPEQFIDIIEELARSAWDLGARMVSSGGGWSRGAPLPVVARIQQRKAFWTAEALRAAREAEQDPRSEGVETASRPAAERSTKAERRAAVVVPLMKAKGITKSRWAALAGVDRSVADGYLAGTSDPRPENRVALAGVLGISPEQLPD